MYSLDCVMLQKQIVVNKLLKPMYSFGKKWKLKISLINGFCL